MSNEHGPCTLTLEDGTHYDLSSLSNAKQDYEIQALNQTFKLNVCRSIVSEIWNLPESDGGEETEIGGVVRREKGDFSIGKYNSTITPSPSTGEPVLIYSDGSPCPSNPDSRAYSIIHFTCDPSTFNPTPHPSLLAAYPPSPPSQSPDQPSSHEECAFFFEWKTHVACPTNVPRQLEGGHWVSVGVFLAFTLIAFVSYLLGFTLYNRFVLNLKGLDAFPRPSLSLPSFSLPGFLRRGGTASGSGGGRAFWRRGGPHGGGGRGYGRVSAYEDDENESFAGRFSLDDEDDEDQGHDREEFGRMVSAGAGDARELEVGGRGMFGGGWGGKLGGLVRVGLGVGLGD